jgi:uncharacterized repeat protein (TIGR02543 family)
MTGSPQALAAGGGGSHGGCGTSGSGGNGVGGSGNTGSEWNAQAGVSGTGSGGGGARFGRGGSGGSGVVVVAFVTSYTATFKSNFVGGASDTTQSITPNTLTPLTSNAFTRTGYTFAGWATSSGGSVEYDDGESVTLTSGLALHAKWQSTLAITTPSVGLSGTFGEAYSLSVESADGSGGNEFSLSSGTLPAGLSLDATTGVISGTPTSSGSQAFVVAV